MCNIAGISKQALWKFGRQEQLNAEIGQHINGLIQDMRKRHKRMGCRTIYYAVKESSPAGRDKFEQIGFAHGYKLRRKRNKIKTTWSQRVEVAPNLIEGITITGINQVWSSDIFYIQVEGKDYYGVKIMDVYSRKLLALRITRSLEAVQNVIALKQAIKKRKGMGLKGCIFHSDRGSQYISNAHKSLLQNTGMLASMGTLPQQNAYSERAIGTIKNDYLYELNLTEKNLRSQVRKVVSYYNLERPHDSLGKMSPDAYEKYVEKLPEEQRPKEVVFVWKTCLSTISQDVNKKKKVAKKKNIYNSYKLA